jgi:hypothetical protein
MAAFLKIENPGVCPPEGFTILGVSLASTSDKAGVIGQFGSGNKHGVAVCLRAGLSPIVFAGTLKMEFSTKPQTVSDGLASKDFGRVCVRYGGTDPFTGASRSSTEDLGFVLSYGEKDWQDVSLALREFVSNAIDRSIRETGDWSAVKVELVEEPQVRAKAGCTRVFIPLSDDVFKFYQNLGRWFLHFSEPDSLRKSILPKRNRNLSDRKAAVIYRKGVRVREFESSDVESLFDYNLDNLRLDESRQASDWDVRQACGRALATADKAILARLFDRLVNTKLPAWEFEFDTYSLQPTHREGPEVEDKLRQNWVDAFFQVAGDDAVLTGQGSVEHLKRKGFSPIVAPEQLLHAAEQWGVPSPSKVLSLDEMSGREISDATPDAQAAVDFVWELIEECGVSNGKQKPHVKTFTSILDAGTKLNGYYRNGVVYINEDLGRTSSIAGGRDVLSDRLLKVALEECCHYTTGATDNSRDFQDYLLDLAVKLARKRQQVTQRAAS